LRDFHVTGVQTCALPIYRTVVALGGLIVALLAIAALMLSSSYRETVQARQAMSLAAAHYADELRASTLREAISLAGSGGVGNAEIGRASCREGGRSYAVV